MRMIQRTSLVLALACLGVSTAQAEDQTPPATQAAPATPATPATPHTQPGEQSVPVWQFLEGVPEGHVFGAAGDFTAPVDFVFAPRSDYWIGMGCTPVGPELRAHVELPEGQGLLVHGVVPESPAAAAGIEQFDILLSYGDAKVATMADLIAAVDARGTEETAVTLLRRGEELSLNVTPVARSEGPAADVLFSRAGIQPMPGVPAEGPFQMRLIHPPAITLTPAMAIPDGVSIQITKEGEQPAKIRVTRGEETWEVTEDDLSGLPEDLRPVVERMLHRPATATVQARPLTLRFEGQPAEGGQGGRILVMPAPQVQAMQLHPAHPLQPSQLDESVRFQLEQIQRQLDELRRTLEAAAAE